MFDLTKWNNQANYMLGQLRTELLMSNDGHSSFIISRTELAFLIALASLGVNSQNQEDGYRGEAIQDYIYFYNILVNAREVL